MPVSYEIRADLNRLYIRYSGVVTRDEVAQAIGEFAADPAARPGLLQFADLSDVADIDMSFNEIFGLARAAADLARQLGAPVVGAFFAPDDLSFGMARIYESLSESHQFLTIRAFREKPEAMAWLNAQDALLPDQAANPGHD